MQFSPGRLRRAIKTCPKSITIFLADTLIELSRRSEITSFIMSRAGQRQNCRVRAGVKPTSVLRASRGLQRIQNYPDIISRLLVITKTSLAQCPLQKAHTITRVLCKKMTGVQIGGHLETPCGYCLRWNSMRF